MPANNIQTRRFGPSPAPAASGQAVLVTHALAAGAVAAWFGLVAREALWLAGVAAVAALLAGVVGSLAVHQGRKRAVAIAAVAWAVVALVGGHVLVTRQSDFWQGFHLDAEVGWYPIANADGFSFEGGEGRYAATTDRFGHRNRLPYPADGRLPVLVQGDSNIFGFNLAGDDTFCRRWMARGGRDCFNAGVPGFGPHQYALQDRILARQGLRADRRLVVFNLANDFSLAALATPYLLPRPYHYLDGGEPRETGPVAHPFRRQVYGHHFIAPLAEYDHGLRTVTLGRDWANVPSAIESCPLAAYLLEKVGARLVAAYVHAFGRDAEIRGKIFNPYNPAWQIQAVEHWPAPYRAFLPHFDALIGRVAAGEMGPTTMVLMPMKEQVVPAARRLLTAGMNAATVDIGALNRVVTAAARKHGVTVIDPTPAFMRHPDPDSLYQRDGHLSAAGMDLLVGETLTALAAR
ncbi:MAG: SGNH/GDSL hydrolase family protein [Magnetospirillum sp.]|nr:SGNH/GDSL hydrolase family protein [Magnetospirillum sp.]